MQEGNMTEGASETAAGVGPSGEGPSQLETGVPLPPWSGVRARRPKRSARPPLDRSQIVTAALAIIDREGVGGLSLRRLAESLGVTPMSLYWHVRDKDELLELVGHAVLAEIDVPSPEGDWRDQLRDIHRAMFRGFLRHPNTAEVLIGRARYGPAGIALFERILTILLEAGLTPEAAFDAYQSLYLFTLGSMATATRSLEFREAQREGVEYLRSLPADRFPSIRAVAPTIGGRTLDEQFEIGLDIQVEGIEARFLPLSEPAD
jgi:AcrR family transcriptional regulator